MNLERTRIPVKELKAGDLIRQTYRSHPDWKQDTGKAEATRTLVIGAVSPAVLPYFDTVHSVTRVTALDVEANRPVVWVAVPDQFVTVIR